MSNFSTNWILYTNPRDKKTKNQLEEEIILSKEIKKKIQLIQKGFR